MATIATIQRKGGVAFKAIIRDRTGRPIRSKTFTRKTDARAWGKCIEGDREKIAAFDAPATINRSRAAGSGLFKFPCPRGFIHSNPFQSPGAGRPSPDRQGLAGAMGLQGLPRCWKQT